MLNFNFFIYIKLFLFQNYKTIKINSFFKSQIFSKKYRIQGFYRQKKIKKFSKIYYFLSTYVQLGIFIKTYLLIIENFYFWNLKFIFLKFFKFYKKILNQGYFYIRGLFLIFFADSFIIDDEPLWEPIEWSLIQTWIFFIFIFAWIAENLISSRFGNYTGRDKRTWFAWYKTFWLLEGWYLFCFFIATFFIIIPFYQELTYNVASVFSWWNWYSKVFFFKFISSYSLILLISYLFLLNVKWMNWKKNLILIFSVVLFLSYLLFIHFITSFFGYFTDPLWYQKSRYVDYIQLSHEPLKWGWGSAKRDHFTYHKISTVFWFKNDAPFAGSFLIIHMYLFLILFFLYIYWLILFRKTFTTKEISFTYSTYCVSALKQFFYFILVFYLFVFISFIISYWRFPIEFLWIINYKSWINNYWLILFDIFFFN
jgi:hypothetical protein